jgi:cation diffusion facilitator family transporter
VGRGHSHTQLDPEVLRSRAGIRTVLLSLALLAVTAGLQGVVYAFSGSVALLSDLIHNAGDALTAIPIGVAFFLRSSRGERWAGRAVVLAIAISAAVALVASIQRLFEPRDLTHLWALAIAGLVGVAGNEAAAYVRLRAGKRLSSPALVADGHHARIDGLVSLGVVCSAAAVGLGAQIADPMIGLAIALLILRISWQAWETVR